MRHEDTSAEAHDHTPEPPAISALQEHLTPRSLDACAALAMSRDGPHDFRPELVEWLFRRSDQLATGIAERIAACLVRAVPGTSAAAAVAAAFDAMAMLRDRTTAAPDRRAAVLAIDVQHYLALRHKAEGWLRIAVAGGLVRYMAAAGSGVADEHHVALKRAA